jgi:hypothetical protein
MTTEQMAAEMKRRLNRPDEDDLFEFPLDYFGYLSQAHRHFYKLTAQHSPGFLYAVTTLTSSDGGNTFTLTDDHYGELLLFHTPGPPTGRPFVPALPEGDGHYWQEGKTLYFLSPYSATLYVRWIPATVADLGQDTDSVLPSYYDDAIIEWACFLAGQKPGFLGNPEVFKANALREWRGEEDNPADMGVLGIISRQSAHQAYEGVSDMGVPWWRGIGS